MAAAIVACARTALNFDPIWNRSLEVLTGYSHTQLLPCYLHLWTYYQKNFPASCTSGGFVEASTDPVSISLADIKRHVPSPFSPNSPASSISSPASTCSPVSPATPRLQSIQQPDSGSPFLSNFGRPSFTVPSPQTPPTPLTPTTPLSYGSGNVYNVNNSNSNSNNYNRSDSEHSFHSSSRRYHPYRQQEK